MVATMPLFPLHRVVVPGESLILHVFEPRYRELLGDLEDDRFGIVLIRSGLEVGGGADYYDVGTTVAVVGRRDTEDGRSLVALAAEQRFRIVSNLDGTVYPRARIEMLDGPESVDGELIESVTQAVRRYLVLLAETGMTADVMVELTDDARALSYQVASLMRLAAPERQELLEMPTAADRLQRERMLLERETGLLRRIING